MMLYNYIAGSSFPPSYHKRFEKWWQFRIFCPSVAVFALGEAKDLVCHDLAYKLLKTDFQGLIYSIHPENQDFGKCSRFFGVSDYPSYVIVPFPVFLPLGLYGDDGDDQEPFLYRCQERLWRILGLYGDDGDDQEPFFYRHQERLWRRLRNCNHLYSDGRQLYSSLRELERLYLHDTRSFLNKLELQFKHYEGSLYKIVTSAELGETSSDKELLVEKIIGLSKDFCGKRNLDDLLDSLMEMMNLHCEKAVVVNNNYIAGSSFPPHLPRGFNEQNFHNLKVVIFALKSAENIVDELARNLLENYEFQGLVYSLRPENRDFLKCAEFFGISAYPSYAIVSYQEFRKYLCLDNYENSSESDKHKELGYVVIVPRQLRFPTDYEVSKNIYRIAQAFIRHYVKFGFSQPNLLISLGEFKFQPMFIKIICDE